MGSAGIGLKNGAERLTKGTNNHFKGWPNDIAFDATSLYGDVQPPVGLEVTGHFPDYVAGSLYRTGPGLYRVPRVNPKHGEFAVNHWFDGFVTNHKFELVAGSDGKCDQIHYSSRMQVDKLVEEVAKTGRFEHITFGQKRDPCESLYRKAKSFFSPVVNTDPRLRNVGVAFHENTPAEIATVDPNISKGRRIISLATDEAAGLQLDADTLEPLNIALQSQLHPSLTGPLSAAHPCKDPKTGELFNYNLELGMNDVYRIFRASPSGKVDILATLKGRDVRGAYIHSMLLTDNFFILCVWPAHFTARGLSVLKEKNLVDAMKFEQNGKTTWYVIDRHHGRGLVKKFTSPPFFCFHTTNAWEEKSSQEGSVDLVCELISWPSADVLKQLNYDEIVSNSSKMADVAARDKFIEANPTSVVRYKLDNVPLKTSPSSSDPTSSARKILDVYGGDLPRYNPHYTFKPHRYVYGVLNRGKSSFLDGLAKTDMKEQTYVLWEVDHHTPGEPIFVPAPNATDEDDGVILCVVFDGDVGGSYLLCLDAKTFTEIGRAVTPVPVGFGFHGTLVQKSVEHK